MIVFVHTKKQQCNHKQGSENQHDLSPSGPVGAKKQCINGEIHHAEYEKRASRFSPILFGFFLRNTHHFLIPKLLVTQKLNNL